jgi:hypothetical protein
MQLPQSTVPPQPSSFTAHSRDPQSVSVKAVHVSVQLLSVVVVPGVEIAKPVLHAVWSVQLVAVLLSLAWNLPVAQSVQTRSVAAVQSVVDAELPAAQTAQGVQCVPVNAAVS